MKFFKKKDNNDIEIYMKKNEEKEKLLNGASLSEIDTSVFTDEELESIITTLGLKTPQVMQKMFEEKEEEEKKDKRAKLYFKIMTLAAIILFLMLLVTRCSVEQLPLPEKVQEIIDKGFADTVDIDDVPEITYEFDGSDTMTNIIWGMNNVLKFENGKSETELRFTSGKENKYNLYLDIHLVDNQGNKGPLLYSSDLITPGQVLLNDSFEVNLPAGTYRGIASINALDPDTFGYVGKSQLNITIYIANTVQ